MGLVRIRIKKFILKVNKNTITILVYRRADLFQCEFARYVSLLSEKTHEKTYTGLDY